MIATATAACACSATFYQKLFKIPHYLYYHTSFACNFFAMQMSLAPLLHYADVLLTISGRNLRRITEKLEAETSPRHLA